MGGFSWIHWLLVVVVVVLVFGTKKLPNIGADLGKAIRGFKQSMKEEDAPRLEADKKDSNKDAD